MKTLSKIILLTLALIAAGACQKSDATKDYGFAKVYIPQAGVTGLDNSYPIPLGPFYQNRDYCCKYDPATGKLQIVVGVIRSGYFSQQQAYSVSLGLCKSETERKLAEYAAKEIPAVELASDYCTIPATIEVKQGQSGETCYVGVDLKALSLQRTALMSDGRYKLLVLGLEISQLSGPAEYELAAKNTSVVVVLDLNSQHWDTVSSDKPESEVRNLFPLIL